MYFSVYLLLCLVEAVITNKRATLITLFLFVFFAVAARYECFILYIFLVHFLFRLVQEAAIKKRDDLIILLLSLFYFFGGAETYECFFHTYFSV